MEGQLIAALRGTLEPNAETIRAAEHHLKHELHEDPSTGQALLNIIFSSSEGGVNLAVRQAAAVNLNAWIKVLNKYDTVFEDAIREYNIDKLQKRPFDQATKEILCSILRFERLLLENSTNRKLFSSYDVRPSCFWIIAIY